MNPGFRAILIPLLFLSLGFGSCNQSASGTDATEEQSGLPAPWNSLDLEIDGAEVVRSSSKELQLVFPFIKPEKANLPYAMILDAMKKAGWKTIEQDYGKEGKFEAPDGKKYGMEVFPARQGVAATLWAL